MHGRPGWRILLALMMAIGLFGPTTGAGLAANGPPPTPSPTPVPTPIATPSPYLLPWPGGESFPCVQGNNGSFSHTGAQAYAWDFAMPTGSVIEAARAGIVRYVQQNSNVGGTNWRADISQANYVVIDQGDGTSAAYLHLMFHGALVAAGDHVRQGQPIAYSGATGFASDPHLHFMVEKTDPHSWFSQSIPVHFADVTANGGVPVQDGTYTSGNAPASVTHAPIVVNIAKAPAQPASGSASAADTTVKDGGAVPNPLDAAFVKDVTFPDGSTVDGGQTFTKAWMLQNDGSQPWPAGSHLALQGTSAFHLLSAATVDAVPSGASTNLSVTLRAPTADTGTTEEEQWRLADSQGNLFGPEFWLRVRVGQDLPTLPVRPVSAGGSQFFPQTGHNVGAPFLAFFRAYGGVDIFGYPRTEAFQDSGMTVQYFQRARMEYHPGLPAGQQVQLTLLGDQITQDQQPFAKAAPSSSSAQHVYFPQTGHSVNFAFLQYFQSHGGLTVFGYPISEELRVDSPAGPTTIQYFQRARFEYHPEHAGTPYAVQLGLLGDETLTAMGWLPLPSSQTSATTTAPPSSQPPAPASLAASLAASAAAPPAATPVTGDSRATPQPVATPVPQAAASGGTAISAGHAATVTTFSLKVHSSPGPDSPVTGFLVKGTRVSILALSAGWAQVGSTGNSGGWVDAGYLAAA